MILALAGSCALHAGAVKGVVVDEYGRPVAQAQVSIKGTDTSVVTGEDGVFDLGLADNIDLSVVAPGYLAIDFNAGALKRQKDKDNVKIILSELNVPLQNTVPGVYGEVPADSYLAPPPPSIPTRLTVPWVPPSSPGWLTRWPG